MAGGDRERAERQARAGSDVDGAAGAVGAEPYLGQTTENAGDLGNGHGAHEDVLVSREGQHSVGCQRADALELVGQQVTERNAHRDGREAGLPFRPHSITPSA